MENSPTPGSSSTSPQTFTARGGTRDEGKDFEELTIISKCLELTFDSNVTEFNISSDDAAFGDFDDLVIETKYINGKEEKIAYQLKHVEDEGGLLTPKILGGTGKKLSIAKYYQNSGEIPHDFSLILYTNKKFKIDNDKFTMDCKIGDADIQVDILKTDHKNLHEFRVNKAENIPKPDSDNYENFLKRFKLQSNQENTTQLERRLMKEFLKKHGTEDTFRRFRDFIRRWKKEKKKKLDKRTVTIKIVESLLTPFVKTISRDLYYTDFGAILRKAILSFNFTTFEETNEVIHKIWISGVSDREIYKCGIKQYLLTEGLDKIMDEKMRAHKYSLISWHLNQCPLIVEVTKDSEDAICEAVELLKENRIEDRRLLLLGQKKTLPDTKCFRDLHSLKSVNKVVYQEILEKFSLSLQGKLHKLQALVDSEDFEKTINTDCLVKMSNMKFNVGGKAEDVPEFYVPRKLPRIVIDFNFLEEKTDDLILISCNGKEEQVRKFINDAIIFDVEELLSDNESFRKTWAETLTNKGKKIFCLHPTECSHEHYSIVANKFPQRNCHHFSYCEQHSSLIWIDTSGDVEGLRLHRTTRELFEEEDVFFQSSKRSVRVVCADPGMGKTTLLKHFHSSKNSTDWVLYVNARQYVSKVKENMDVQKFVFSSVNEALDRNFIGTFFSRKKIIFMWDGLDEVMDNEERDRVYGFIGNIQQLGFAQFITARSTLQTEVEQKLNTMATNIMELSEYEQHTFLKNRLSKKYNEEQFFDINAKITENVEHLEAYRVLGIPLQLFHLTELFLQTSNIDDITKKPLTAITLFEHFVTSKFNAHFEKVKIEDNYMQKLAKETTIKRYKLLGTKICLEKIVDLNFFDQSEQNDLTAIQSDDDPFGFVKNLVGMSFFVHESYAEYFAALFLSENYRRISDFKKVYFDQRCGNLRFLLDLILAKDCPAHTAVLYKNLKALEDHKEFIFKKDAAGRNVLHIALSWTSEELKVYEALRRCFTIVGLEPLEPFQHHLDKFKILGRIFKYMLEDKRELTPVFDNMFNMDYIFYSNDSLLNLAVMSNDVDVVKYIYENNESVQKREDVNFSLIYAALISNLEICKFLINNGAQVNFCDEDDVTPLIYAAAEGHLKIAEVLIDNKAEVNMKDKAGRSPLFFAVWHNHLPVVQLFTKNKANVNLRNKQGLTPLLAAASTGHFEIAKALIDSKAEVNVTNDEVGSPLLLAASNNQLAVVQLLIQNKAEVNLSNKEGITPLMKAAVKGHSDVSKILIANKAGINMTSCDGVSPLMHAVVGNQLAMTKLLIENNADVNLSDKKYGFTPLIMATLQRFHISKIMTGISRSHAEGRGTSHFGLVHHQFLAAQLLTGFAEFQNRYLEIAKFLIENKAEVNLSDAEGNSPLSFSIWSNKLPLVQLLIDNNADVNNANKNGITPLMTAAEEGHLEIAKILIDSGAEVNETDTTLSSPLFLAALNNQLSVVQLLLENNAEVNFPSKDGLTSLMVAAKQGHSDIAKKLIENGAEVNMTDSSGHSSLFYSVANNLLPMVELLIENKAEVNLQGKQGKTPLWLAAQEGHFDIAKILIDNKAEVNKANSELQTPLLIAVVRNKLKVVQLLIENSAEVNFQNKVGLTLGVTPLMMAAAAGHLDIAKTLIENRAEVNMTDSNGQSSLVYSAANNRLPMVELLIENKAEVNLQGKQGKSPLWLAAQEGHFDIAKILIDNKAEVNKANSELQTPLLIAVVRNKLKVVQLLIENSAEVNFQNKVGLTLGVTPLMMAAAAGHLDIAKTLIENRAEVNMTDSNGQSSLVYSAANNRLPMVELLIENKAEVNLQGKQGKTPLWLAAQEGHFNIAKILIDNKAEVNKANSELQTPLLIAVVRNKLKVVQLLIENSAEVNFQSKVGLTLGVTPLMMAAAAGHLDIAKTLIENRAEVNMTDSNGQSSLVYSAANNRLPMVELLIANNAKVNFQNKKGATPLMVAVQEGHLVIAKFLIDNGADVNMTDCYGNTPLFIAVSENQKPVVQLLIDNKANINHPRPDGLTSLMKACFRGSYEIVNYLLEQKAQINCKCRAGNALHFSVMGNNLDVIKLLIQKGADIEAKDRFGRTPVDLPNQSPDVRNYFRSTEVLWPIWPFLQWWSKHWGQ